MKSIPNSDHRMTPENGITDGLHAARLASSAGLAAMNRPLRSPSFFFGILTQVIEQSYLPGPLALHFQNLDSRVVVMPAIAVRRISHELASSPDSEPEHTTSR